MLSIMMRSTGLETAARTSCTSDPGDWAADTACSTAWVRYTQTQAHHTAINVDGKYQTGTFYGCFFCNDSRYFQAFNAAK